MEHKDQIQDEIAGQVFDLNGACLATIKRTDSKALVNSEEFHVKVTGDSLFIARLTITSTLAEASKSILLARSNELQKRKEDIVALDQMIKGLMAQLEQSADDTTSITEQLASLAWAHTKHKRAIQQLEDQKEVYVKYEEGRSGQSAVIEAGKLVKLSWFPAPILWCPSITMKEEKDVVIKTQNVPVSGLHLPPPLIRVLAYEADFDQKGLIYWLGTNSGTQAFQNPVAAGVINLTTTGTDLTNIQALFSYSNSVDCYWCDNGSFTLHLGQYSLSPTHYCLRVAGSERYIYCPPLNWTLEGSVNGNTWSLLYNHANDTSIPQVVHGTASWRLNQHSPGLQFNFIRLRQTGPTQYTSPNYFLFGGFEIYGTITKNS